MVSDVISELLRVVSIQNLNAVTIWSVDMSFVLKELFVLPLYEADISCHCTINFDMIILLWFMLFVK